MISKYNNYLTEVEKRDILDSFKDGEICSEIAKRLHRNHVSVAKFLKKNGYQLQSNSNRAKKFKVNESFFDNIDSEEKAYFLGFLYADGHNNRTTNSIIIGLKEDDKEILEKLRISIGYTGELRYRRRNKEWKGCYENSKNSWVLCITNQYLSKQLEKLGCIQQKTFNTKFPVWLNKEMYPHFIRGYFDGDGSIYKSIQKNRTYFHMSFDGTKELLEEFSKIFLDELGVKIPTIGKRHPDRENNACYIKYFHSKMIPILSYIYKNSTIFLKRKNLKYQEYLSHLNGEKSS